MILHQRKPDTELLFLRALNIRTELSQKDSKKLDILEKGYTGELEYDIVYDQELAHLYVFRNIYLKIEESTLQIDTLIVTDEGFIVHEIKNFKGLYEYSNSNMKIRGFKLSSNPLDQINRTTNKLIALNYLYNLNLHSDGKVIFTNIEFSIETDDQTIWDKIIMRNQLRRYFHQLKDFTSTQAATSFANYITDHLIDNPYFERKANEIELKKGVYCLKCNSFNLIKSNVQFICQDCGCRDTIHTHVLKAIADIHALFNQEQITVHRLFEILNGSVSKRTLLRVLRFYCSKDDKKRYNRYIFNYHDFEDALENSPRTMRYKDYSRIK